MNVKAGDKVRVHIGGVDRDPTGHEATYRRTSPRSDFLLIDMYDWGCCEIPEVWVEPVTPPCPWTELGTIVRTKSGDIYELADRGWFIVGDGGIADYARTIAPFNPVRLVPEQPIEWTKRGMATCGIRGPQGSICMRGTDAEDRHPGERHIAYTEWGELS